MSLFTTDWKKQVRDILPAELRSVSMINWIYSLIRGLQTKIDEAYPFEIDIKKRAIWNGQKMVLQAALRDIFGIPIIVETVTDTVLTLYFYNESEGVNVYSYNEGEPNNPLFVYNESEPTGGYDFIVKVPFEELNAELERRIKAEVNSFKLAGKTFIITDDAMVIERTLTSAEILQLFTTPIDLIPAPGAGKRIKILSINTKLIFNSIAYVAGGNLNFTINGVSVKSTGSVIPAAASYWYDVSPLDISGTTSVDNAPFRVSAATSNPTTGNSTIKISVVYKIVNS